MGGGHPAPPQCLYRSQVEEVARSLASGVQWQPQQQSGLISPQRCSRGHSGGRGGQRGYLHRTRRALPGHWPRPWRHSLRQPSQPRPRSPQPRAPPRRSRRSPDLRHCLSRRHRQLRGRYLLRSAFFRSPEKDGLFGQSQ